MLKVKFSGFAMAAALVAGLTCGSVGAATVADSAGTNNRGVASGVIGVDSTQARTIAAEEAAQTSGGGAKVWTSYFLSQKICTYNNGWQGICTGPYGKQGILIDSIGDVYSMDYTGAVRLVEKVGAATSMQPILVSSKLTNVGVNDTCEYVAPVGGGVSGAPTNWVYVKTYNNSGGSGYVYYSIALRPNTSQLTYTQGGAGNACMAALNYIRALN